MEIIHHKLSPQQFEELVVLICQKVLGIATANFSQGPDGGRDASFSGRADHIPSNSNPWDGKFVIQAKHFSEPNVSCTGSRFKSRLKKEVTGPLKKLVDKGELDYYLLFTNARLSAGTYANLTDFIDTELKIKNLIVGIEKINLWLDAYPDIVKTMERKSVIVQPPSSKSPSVMAGVVESLPSDLLDNLAFLILSDRFPIGVWGRSLVETAAQYGHDGDPGSITISVACLDALKMVYPDTPFNEIDKFTQYLIKRRNKENGAIGMRKSIGSAVASKPERVENRRHTATGAKYLKDYAGKLDLALESLKYVIVNRTDKGSWSASFAPSDEAADPFTTAYVLQVLKQFEDDRNLLNQIEIENKKSFITSYRQLGLTWLYEYLEENDGWWLYKNKSEPADEISKKRAYSFTIDILNCVPDFWTVDEDFATIHKKVMEALFAVWEKFETGIPTGPNNHRVELRTTVAFATICWISKNRYPKLALETQRRFLSNLRTIMEYGDSDSSGWARTVIYLKKILNLDINGNLSYRKTKSLVENIWALVSKGKLQEVNEILAKYPSWVSTHVKKQIETIRIVPP